MEKSGNSGKVCSEMSEITLEMITRDDYRVISQCFHALAKWICLCNQFLYGHFYMDITGF